MKYIATLAKSFETSTFVGEVVARTNSVDGIGPKHKVVQCYKNPVDTTEVKLDAENWGDARKQAEQSAKERKLKLVRVNLDSDYNKNLGEEEAHYSLSAETNDTFHEDEARLAQEEREVEELDEETDEIL